jgi:hypothetical protein
MMRMVAGVGSVLLGLAVVVGGWSPASAGQPPESKSAYESDPKGWVDLLATDSKLANWKRVPVGKKGTDTTWAVVADGKILRCNGVGVHEMLLWAEELTDCIFHVEWRFEPLPDLKKAGYNSGVYIRNSADGQIWHQAQVGANVGQLFGRTLLDGQPKQFNVKHKAPNRGKAIGEWNVYELTAKGPTLTLWVNGAETAKLEKTEVLKGHIGLEAEGYVIEFRNLLLKRL